MLFDWDDANREHVRRHAVTPDEAEQVFRNAPIDLAAMNRKQETRRMVVGETDAGRVLTIVSTQRASRVRVITAYPANRRHRRIYEEEKQHPADD
jgi:uncharacterized protein